MIDIKQEKIIIKLNKLHNKASQNNKHEDNENIEKNHQDEKKLNKSKNQDNMHHNKVKDDRHENKKLHSKITEKHHNDVHNVNDENKKDSYHSRPKVTRLFSFHENVKHLDADKQKPIHDNVGNEKHQIQSANNDTTHKPTKTLKNKRDDQH